MSLRGKLLPHYEHSVIDIGNPFFFFVQIEVGSIQPSTLQVYMLLSHTT